MTTITSIILKAKKQIRKMVILYKINVGIYTGFKYLVMTEKLLKGDY